MGNIPCSVARKQPLDTEKAAGLSIHDKEARTDHIRGHRRRPSATLQFQAWFLVAQYLIGAVLSLPVLISGAWTASISLHQPAERCASFMHMPILTIGTVLLLFSVFGLVLILLESIFRSPRVATLTSWLHLILLFCGVIILFCFAIFSLEVTNENLGHSVHAYGNNYTEYRIYEYPKWMQHRVRNQNYWQKVKKCIIMSSICITSGIPDSSSNTTHRIAIEGLTPIQKGCCLPPSACDIQYTGAQVRNHMIMGGPYVYGVTNDYEVPHVDGHHMGIDIHAYTRDCPKWNSDPYQLCYNCDTCKAGVIQANMSRWKKIGIMYVVLVMIMVCNYALFSCYGFVREKADK
ncbi:hypothetical protein KP509_01G045000 [Ceratopteris richardii]|uniref:Uncharacterized protein n=1 Tax=Ceratopteris richardii TaxID=49495 RepID=A0A8T2VK88_CERRI|nr:hypothetical protein KP509_01G045000 [Ceratopteris richardii]